MITHCAEKEYQNTWTKLLGCNEDCATELAVPMLWRSFFLLLKESWDAQRRVRYLATRIYFCSNFVMIYWCSLKRRDKADSSDWDRASRSYFECDFLRCLLNIFAFAILLSWRREAYYFFLRSLSSLRRIDYSLRCSISRIISYFSFSLRFSCIFRCNFALICFCKDETSICIFFSFSYVSFSSYSFFFVSVNLSFS